MVAGTAPADLVAETPRVVAFCDNAPITPGHLLVVPRTHGSGLADVSDDDAAAMTVLARRLAVALRDTGLRHPGLRHPGPGTAAPGTPGAGVIDPADTGLRHPGPGATGPRRAGPARRLAVGGWWRGRRGERGAGAGGAPVTGTNLLLADGSSAGQDVFHVHLHVIPRYAGDGVRLRTGPRGSTPGERADVADRVRAALDDG
ncbi:HIT family protein [Pseudonocardia sp. KRD-291]|nr:HIT family protein [Pseudonocardia sp. KRD291]